MSISSLYGSALMGLERQAERLAESADTVARATTTEAFPAEEATGAATGPGGPPPAAPPDGASPVTGSREPAPVPQALRDGRPPLADGDIVAQQVVQMEAAAAFKANAAVVRTGEEVDKSLLDIVG